MSGARCAERANEAGARGRNNKIAGVLITAIPFGSAAGAVVGKTESSVIR